MKRLLFLLALLPALAGAQTRKFPGTMIFPDLAGKTILKTDSTGRLLGDTAKIATAKSVVDTAVKLRAAIASVVDTAVNLRAALAGKVNFYNTSDVYLQAPYTLDLAAKHVRIRVAAGWAWKVAEGGAGTGGAWGSVESKLAFSANFADAYIYYHAPAVGAATITESYNNSEGNYSATAAGKYAINATSISMSASYMSLPRLEQGYGSFDLRSGSIYSPALRVQNYQNASLGSLQEWHQYSDNGTFLGLGSTQDASMNGGRNYVSGTASSRGFFIAPDFRCEGSYGAGPFRGGILFHTDSTTGFGLSLAVPRYPGSLNLDVEGGLKIDTNNRIFLTSTANSQIENTTDLLGIDANGKVSKTRPATAYTPTAQDDPAGKPGDITYSAGYLYIKTDSGWGRAALDFSF